jgi:hypothetical protein
LANTLGGDNVTNYCVVRFIFAISVKMTLYYKKSQYTELIILLYYRYLLIIFKLKYGRGKDNGDFVYACAADCDCKRSKIWLNNQAFRAEILNCCQQNNCNLPNANDWHTSKCRDGKTTHEVNDSNFYSSSTSLWSNYFIQIINTLISCGTVWTNSL